MRNNLSLLIQNDAINAEWIGTPVARKETVQLPNTRIQGDGTVELSGEVTFATTACDACGKRDVKLLVCSGCKKANCKWVARGSDVYVYHQPTDCNRDCQKKDWVAHKGPCKKATALAAAGAS